MPKIERKVEIKQPNKNKGGEERCRLEELGLAGEVVGAEVLAGALVEVGEEAGLALVGACHTGIRMLAGIEEPLLMGDMAIHIMVGAMLHSIDTPMAIHCTKTLGMG